MILNKTLGEIYNETLITLNMLLTSKYDENEFKQNNRYFYVGIILFILGIILMFLMK